MTSGSRLDITLPTATRFSPQGSGRIYHTPQRDATRLGRSISLYPDCRSSVCTVYHRRLANAELPILNRRGERSNPAAQLCNAHTCPFDVDGKYFATKQHNQLRKKRKKQKGVLSLLSIFLEYQRFPLMSILPPARCCRRLQRRVPFAFANPMRDWASTWHMRFGFEPLRSHPLLMRQESCGTCHLARRGRRN